MSFAPRIPLTICASMVVALACSAPAFAVDPSGIPLCTATGDQLNPVAVSDGAGGVIVAWHDSRPSAPAGGLCYAQRLDASGAILWTADGVALSTTGDANPPAIASDGAGGAYLAFGGSVSSPRAQWVNASGVPQWGADGVQLAAVTSADELAITPDINGAGGVIVAWRQGNGAGGSTDILAQKVSSAGVIQWTPSARAIASSTQNERLPALVSDGSGGILINWHDDSADKVQRFNASGNGVWSQIPVGPLANKDVSPMVSDQAGGAIIAWAGSGGVFAQRVSSTGLRMWSPHSTGDTLSITANKPTLISYGSGGAIITWQDVRSTTNYNLYAQYVDPSGTQMWTPGGAEVCYFTRDQLSPVIVSDGGTGAIIAWYDQRTEPTTGTDIYAEHLNSSGSPLWIPDGEPVCTAPTNQDLPTIASDGTGGAWVAWQDLRNGNEDIYAQRVGASGATLSVPPGPARTTTVRAWPNPFSERVEMAFDLVAASAVRMEVVDLQGRIVRSLGTTRLEPGRHSLRWDGLANDGRPAGEGVFFLRASGDGVALSRSVVRLK